MGAPVEFSDDSAQVRMEARSEVWSQMRLAMFRAEDGMDDEIGVGVAHSLSPLRGLCLPRDLLPRAYALGYYLTPLRGSVLCNPSPKAYALGYYLAPLRGSVLCNPSPKACALGYYLAPLRGSVLCNPSPKACALGYYLAPLRG
jgi:hypothetical protein